MKKLFALLMAIAIFAIAQLGFAPSAAADTTPTATTVTAAPTPIPAELKTTTINVEVHAFIGSEVDSLGNLVGNGRYDGWFAVIMDDGTPLVPWFQTDGLFNATVEIPNGHTALMHWDTQSHGSEEPYIIDPSLCIAEGVRATTTDYRDIHMDQPESPRSAGRRSVEAFCGASKPTTPVTPPSTTTPTTTPEGSSTTVTTTVTPPAPTTPSSNPPVTVTCGPTSPYWNPTTGSCQLPFTGVNSHVMTILPWVFVAIAVGIVLAINGALASRRPTTVRVN